MVMNNGLMRIFWPSCLPNGPTSGIAVGWRNSEFDIFVVTVLCDVEDPQCRERIGYGILYRNCAHPIQELLDRCGHSRLQVLGRVNPQEIHESEFDPRLLTLSTTGSRFPKVSYPPDLSITFQLILFDMPHPVRMQYFSLTPIPLALGDDRLLGELNGSSMPSVDLDEASERKRKYELVDKLQYHTIVTHPMTHKEAVLPKIINQINCCYELAALLQNNIGLVGTRMKRGLSVGERVVESATNLWDYFLRGLLYAISQWIYPVILRLSILAFMAHRIAGELILLILDWRLTPDASALKDISATAQQVDIRLQQFCYWPIQYLTLRKRKGNWESITTSHPEYIRFYNSLWLVANDVIIGIALGSYIIENSEFVAAQVDIVFHTWSIQGLRKIIIWLMEWPGGLKLNNELAAFLGDLFLWAIDHWADSLSMLRSALPAIIHFIGFSSFAGATMPISLFSDLVTFLSLHIYSFYVASAKIFHWQLLVIISLFHLFRGKKRNVLRNRIDSCDYDLDQLLLGTILFTLLFFLLPTVFVFYLTFASARTAIIMLKALLDTLLACLNHFPLFALMLRIKDPGRLPGGICFALQRPPAGRPSQQKQALTAHIILKSVPLPLSVMFKEYFQLGNRIRKHYLSPGVFLCLITGRFVPPIHRKNLYSLQYSMLPAQRAGIAELWSRLMGSHDRRGNDLK